MVTLWYMPFETMKANLMEVMNDYTILALTYHLWCFTDIVWKPETRHELGFVFIGIVFTNIFVHIVFMLRETCIRAKLICKRRLNRKKAEKGKLLAQIK